MGFVTRRRISDCRLFLWICLSFAGKPWAKGGVLTRDLARWLPCCVGLAGLCMRPVAYGPHWPRLPPPTSPAPIRLACLHGVEEGSALVLGIGLRLWKSALGFPSLSLKYKSRVFLLFGSTDTSSFSCSSLSSSRVDTGSGAPEVIPVEAGGVRGRDGVSSVVASGVYSRCWLGRAAPVTLLLQLVWGCFAVPFLQAGHPGDWFRRSIAGILSIPAFTLSCPGNS